MAGQQKMEVAAGLVFYEGRLLITQRLPGDHLGGLWEFPGGKREPGESFEDCLRRELLEELAIKVRVCELRSEVEHAYPRRTVHIKFFHCNLAEGEPRAIGCQAFEWVSAAELGGYEFPPADAQLLSRLESGEWWEDD
jgi:mutator protein MutT